MMRVAILILACVALSSAQFPYFPFPYQATLQGGLPQQVVVTPSPIPTTTPLHHRNPVAEQQLAHTIVAHEHSNRVLQQQQQQQLAAITGVQPTLQTVPIAGVNPFLYPQYPGLQVLG